MRVAIVSTLDVSEVSNILEKYSFEIVNNNPDFVVSYGGDGTILYSERMFPSIPKLTIKTTTVCRKCDYTEDNLGEVLTKIKNKDYRIEEQTKLVAIHRNHELLALNEIQIRNKLPIRAMRFSLSVDDKVFNEVVGDGVIISSPFGSTGYYKAAGGTPLKEGIGICFNNPHTKVDKTFVVPEDSEVKIKIKRDTAYLAADNYENLIELNEGDEILIKKSKEKARLIIV